MRNRIVTWFNSTAGRVAVLLTAVLVVGVGLTAWFWPDFRATTDASESVEPLSATIRNLALIVGGVIAVILTTWRLRISERQTAISDQQAETARLSLLNDRFQRGAEMLGSDVLAVRMGGIHALDALARERPDLYHIQIVMLLCAFVRHPTGTDESMLTPSTGVGFGSAAQRPDVVAAIKAIAYRSDEGLRVEDDIGVPKQQILDLSKSDLRWVQLPACDLSGADLRDARMERVFLNDADLSHAILHNADLTRATLIQTDFCLFAFEGGVGAVGVRG